MYPSQHDDRPSRSRDGNAPYRPGYGGHAHGMRHGWLRSGSVFVKTQEHPLLALAAVAGMGLAATALVKARKQATASRPDETRPTSLAASAKRPGPKRQFEANGAVETLVVTELAAYQATGQNQPAPYSNALPT